MAYVHKDSEVRTVKNSGYLLRNWKQINHFFVDKVTQPPSMKKYPNEEYLLLAFFDDGRIFEEVWLDKDVLWNWLKRPVFIGLKLYWFGKEHVITKN